MMVEQVVRRIFLRGLYRSLPMAQTVGTASENKNIPADAQDISLIDCDVHNQPNSIDELMVFLSEGWRAYIRQSGFKDAFLRSLNKI